MSQDTLRNTMVWGSQATIDFTYPVKHELSKVVGDFVENKLFSDFRDKLISIKEQGLEGDMNLRLEENEQSLLDLGKAKKYLESMGFEPTIQLGGNPAISALRGYHLAGKNSGLPKIRYVGLYPESVKQYIEGHAPDLKHIFNETNCFYIKEQPQSLAIEALHKKIIFAYGPGRNLTYLPGHDASFTAYIDRLMLAATGRNGKIVVALAVPWPLETGSALLTAIRNRLGDRAVIFVGSASFRQGGNTDIQRAKEIYEKILSKADIISFNDIELHDLHTAIVGDGTFQNIPLAIKLKQLQLQAIKVCHSAEGAILELGCQPEKLITSPDFRRDPGFYLKETLQLAADGASYTIDSVGGKMASEAMVRVYSSSINDRSTELFRGTFLKTVERPPGGIVAVQAPVVAQPISALTGIGAIFDSLLLSFLMRD